jgi:hypothetical protein
MSAPNSAIMPGTGGRNIWVEGMTKRGAWSLIHHVKEQELQSRQEKYEKWLAQQQGDDERTSK